MKSYAQLRIEAIDWMEDCDIHVPEDATWPQIVSNLGRLWDGGFKNFLETQLHDSDYSYWERDTVGGYD
jgi:hypothetical protein